jgi:hypothetical protein
MKTNQKFAHQLAQFAKEKKQSQGKESIGEENEEDGEQVSARDEQSEQDGNAAVIFTAPKEKEITKLITKEDRKTGTFSASFSFLLSFLPF